MVDSQIAKMGPQMQVCQRSLQFSETQTCTCRKQCNLVTSKKTWALSTQDAHAQRKQMEPVDLNESVHTARKQHQRICVRIRARASSVDWAQKKNEFLC